jgi:hypothetical protein
MANKKVFKPVNTMRFTKDLDGELFRLINNYAHEMKGVSAHQAIRNLLFETLPQAIEQKKRGRESREAGQPAKAS